MDNLLQNHPPGPASYGPSKEAFDKASSASNTQVPAGTMQNRPAQLLDRVQASFSPVQDMTFVTKSKTQSNMPSKDNKHVVQNASNIEADTKSKSRPVRILQH